MNLNPLGLVLAVSTAWAMIFLGCLPVRALELHSREILKACGAWVTVGICAPTPIFHWYFIFALLCLVAWMQLRRERLLSGKVWLWLASALGISLGIVFFLQAAPVLFPATLPPRDHLLLLGSIYLGGAVTALAYVEGLLAKDSEVRTRELGGAKWLMVLVVAWIAVVAVELKLATDPAPSGSLSFDRRLIAIPMLLLLVLSFQAFQSRRKSALRQSGSLLATVAALAFLIQFFAHWLSL